TRADADEGGVVALEPMRHHQMLHHEMRARAWRSHADLHALEVCRRAVGLRFARQHTEHVAGELTELYDGGDRLSSLLHLGGGMGGVAGGGGGRSDGGGARGRPGKSETSRSSPASRK